MLFGLYEQHYPHYLLRQLRLLPNYQLLGQVQ
jgi:hypothetical protein